MHLDIQEIMDLAPQRFPMLLIDVVEELKPFESAKGIKAVSYNEPYFQGHFPQRPIMPGIMIIEACTQLICIMITSKKEYSGKMIYYSQISKAKFFSTVLPGSLLELKAEKKSQLNDLIVSRVEASVKGKIVFTAEIMVWITE